MLETIRVMTLLLSGYLLVVSQMILLLDTADGKRREVTPALRCLAFAFKLTFARSAGFPPSIINIIVRSVDWDTWVFGAR